MTGTKLTFEELKKRKKPNTKEVPILLDPELGVEYNELLDKIQSYPESDLTPEQSAELAELEAKEKKLEKKLEDNTVIFKFRAVNSILFDEIMNGHPPTAAQIKDAHKKGLGDLQWNIDTLPPALVASSLVEPDLTEEEVNEMWRSDDWNSVELAKLFEAALTVNQQFVSVNLKKD